jgi:hypothetical protein
MGQKPSHATVPLKGKYITSTIQIWLVLKVSLISMAEQGSAPPLGVCPQGSPLLEATPCSNPSWQCQSSQSSPRSVKLTNYDRHKRTLCVKDYLMYSNVNINHLRTKDFLLILWWHPFKMWFLKWLRLCSSVRINKHTLDPLQMVRQYFR